MKEEEKKEDKNKVKQRELLYKLIISQLFYDGHQKLAQELAVAVNHETTAVAPSDRLMTVVIVGVQHEHEAERPLNRLEYTLGPGIDLEYETEPQTSAPEPAMYETAYVTSHKDKCRAGAFSADGQLVATGSVDASIKILDVDRMLAKSDPDAVELHPDAVVGHPVIRTLYDHLEEITCLEFHPREQVLISGSRDTNVKMFDFSKTSAKKAFKTFTDAEQVTTLSIHPGGDILAVGTEGSVVRVYDINSCQCYVCPYPREHHTGSITCVKYSSDARLYASASRDGHIKLWDGVSGRCVQTFSKAHDGAEVCSVLFSRNGKYVLSAGMDSNVKLWEISTARCLMAYTGAGSVGKQEHSAHAMFNHTEDFVMFPDEATTSLCAWDARNAIRKNLLSLGHNGPVRHMVHSPCSPSFITCSDDFRARFWYRRNVH
ncbi:cleavage stimulation factor subunit 1 Cst50 [Oratosquilla oratoria]|uniref:cleavage stimulation factor subunit 1 Cst50 n=1 Tax=Oratosquilla oratoria TaxID=337810 RepID=UPI003F7732F3